MSEVLIAVEGMSDRPIAEAIVRHFGRVPRVINDSGGSTQIDDRLKRWSQPSNRHPLLVLRDWDARDQVACAPALVSKLLPAVRSESLALRIAVRSIESWMMADLEAASDFFATKAISENPDDELLPKLALVNACRGSRTRRIRQGMVPEPGSSAPVGVGYVDLTREFVQGHWRIDRARLGSPSFASALGRIEALIASKVW